GQVLHVLVEVGLTGGLDAIGAATEVDRVEVVLQDPVFGLLLGYLCRDDHLAELAEDAVLVVPGGHLDVLLGDRRAPTTATGELAPGGPSDSGDVESRVGPEAAVLRGQHGVLHAHGNLRKADRDAIAVLRDIPA